MVIIMKIHMLKDREKAMRGTALVLAAALVFTSIDLTVFATNGKKIKTQEVITGFAELDKSVAVQLLPVGALESEIVFPDMLTVTVDTKSVEESVGDVTQKTENPTKEDTESEEIQTPEKGTEHEESTDSGENQDTGENTDSGEHTETGENTDSGEGTGTGESTDSGESTGTGESIDSGENAGPEERKGTEEDAAEEEQPAEEVYAVVEEQPVAKAYTAEEEQPPEEEGAAEEVSPAPVETIPPVKSTRETSIHVTWEHNRADSFDSSTLGNHYVYTPVIPEEYRVADGVSLPQISVTIAATGGQGPAELLALLEKLPDPLTYLSTGVENKEIIDREQLAEAREQLDSWLAENQTDDTENKETLSGEEKERLAELIARLEGLEHIRDTETDCMDLECPYHYPEMIQQRMAEDELPELLTLEDLVEDYGVEPPEENALPAAVWDTDQPLRAPAKAPALTPHPQTLMVTTDNENNSHTGKADGDIDENMGFSNKKHPIELAFTLDELPAQSAYLAVKAYDVDEDYGETDYVYLNDDIYLPMDQTNQFNKNYNNETIGYLSGTNNTWNTTVLEIPLEKLKKGKNVISVTVAQPTWIVRIDWMQLVLDGGAADPDIEKFSLELQDTSTKGKTVTVQSLVTIRQKGKKEYATEYTLTQTETGNALDACFGKAQSQEQIALSMPLDSPSGVYKITGILKDPDTEAIKATDSFSFYFNQGVGLGPKVSHTLSPDTLTNRDVTITVKAEVMPKLGITDVKVAAGATKTATVNKKYTFTINYKLKGSDKSFLYPVWVDNIDKTAPVITYTPVTVVEEEKQETVEKLFGEALSVSDNHRLADKPLTYTIPKDIAALPGKKTIQVTASDAAGNTTTKKCEITVTAKPLELKLGALTAAAGSKDSFDLKAVLAHTGGDTIKETGFVWGVMPAPTLEFHNGSSKTASVITAKNGNLNVKATGLNAGVEYYARAYARVTAAGKEKVYYSEAGKFGFGIPQYGTFSVSSVSGSNGKATFTITRSNGTDKAQTVYCRTVNGSAVGGTHFTHIPPSPVYFKEGETSKTVTVTELGVTNAYQSKEGTKYSNADRTYSLEIYRVTGGGTIDQARRSMLRTMPKDSSYTVDRSVYTTEKTITHVADTSGKNGKRIADTNQSQGGKKTNVSFLKNRYKDTNYHTSSSFSGYYTDARQQEYLKSTAGGWYYRYVLRAYEQTDGYEHAYLGTEPLEDKNYDIRSESAAVEGVKGQLWACNFLQPAKKTAGTYYFPDTRTGGGEESYYPKNSSGTAHGYNGKTWVKLGVDQTCYAYFGATGADTDEWYVDGLQSFVMVNDEKEPALLGVAPMAGGTYLPGDPITVALVFDEIVDRQNSSLSSSLTISTNVGTLSYAGGADTNVLYFTGKVSSTVSLNSTDTLKVNSISNLSSIKDMCNLSGTSQNFSGGNTNIKVDGTEPALTVRADTSGSLPRHKATITATGAVSIQYAWTKDTVLPGYGWQTITSGKQLTESRGTAGQSQTWYLHVLATAASGASTHKYLPFTFMNPAITDVSVRAGGATSSADVADVWKSGKYIVVQYAGVQSTGTTLTFDGPKKEVKNITSSRGSANLYVTENGSYTVTLTDTYGNVISKTIEVRKIDRKNPTVTLRSGSSTGADTVYNELTIAVLPEDTGGSGVAKVEYAWTNTAGAPSAWKILTAAADGSYQAQYTAAETTKTAKYLHVRVTDGAGNVSETVKSGPYQVIKKAVGAALPSITVTGNPSSWTKSATLTWKAAPGSGTGAGALAFVYTPKGTVTENMTVGSCTVTKNGIYEFMVMDKFGNSEAAEVLVTRIDNEAPKLDSLTAAGGKPGTIGLLGATDDHTAVYDKKGNITGYQGSGIRTREYRMQGESTWTTFTGDSFTVAKNGNYVVRLTDNAGNVSEEYRVEMTGMDVTAPTVSCVVNGTRNGTSGWYLDSDVSVKLTFTDMAGTEGGTPSGIQSAAYQWVTDTSQKPAAGMVDLDAAAVAAGEYTISLSDYYGTCYLYYKVTDRKGNIQDGFSEQIKKDNVHRLEFTGPNKAQPLSAGLPMSISLTYGPSGGKLTGTAQTEVLAELPAELPAYQGIYRFSELKKKQAVYTVNSTGTKQIQYYKNAYSDSTSCEQKTFYVRQVTFDSQGGSSVEPQLIWTTYNSLTPGAAVQCAVTEPQKPVREGYTFGGWYKDAECTDIRKFNFDTQSQLMTDITLFAKWIPNSYRVYYNLSLPDGSVYESEDMYKSYVHGQELTMPVPSQEGYVFCGWYDNAGYTGTAYTKIGATEYGDKTCYGYFRDVQKPELAASVESNVSPNTKGWYSTDQIRIVLSYSDNKGVKSLYGKVDDGGYEEIPDVITEGGTTVAKDYACVEGTHTYTFKAVDAAGNETVTDVLTVKLDTIKPVIGDAAFNEGYKNLWNWLIRKDSLEITIPVEEAGSGIESVDYELIREDSSTTAGRASVKKASGENSAGYTAVIYVNPDFKGKIKITAKDYAGNVSDTKMIGTDGSGIHGIIVEDHAPEITFSVNGSESPAEEYEKAPTVDVTVKDDKENVISAGLASVAYQVGNSAEHVLQEDFATGIRTEVKFSIPKEKLPETGADITVKAVDNAGNRAERKITVRIHTHRAVLVQAVEPTCLTKGNKAYYVCDCGRWYANSSCTTEITLQDVELPAKGHTEAIDPVKEATCMQTGLTQGSHCSDCGLVIKAQTVTPALGHNYSGDYAYDAGGHWRVCSRCAALEEKHGHVYDDDKDAICNDCGFERTIKNSEPEKPGGGGTETSNPPTPSGQPDKPEDKAENKPTDKPENKLTEKAENKPTDKPENKSTDKPENKLTNKAENKPTDKPENKLENKPDEQPDIRDDVDVPEMTEDGKANTSGEAVPTGNVQGMADTSTALDFGDGTVTVTVVCAEQEYTAGVSDTAAVVNAVLTPAQLQSAAAGENIEIRIEVKDISGNVPEKDKSAIENGIKEYHKEIPDLVLGMYVDISLFVKIGEADWNAVTGTAEPVEVVIGIPQKLQSIDREFFIIRSHEGEYTFLTDMDDAPDTVTIHTDRFSAYAIAYKHVSPVSQNCKCSLCHICPTFLGICYFVWLILIMAVLLIVWRVVQRNRNVGEKQEP